jgi:hypothetical protein
MPASILNSTTVSTTNLTSSGISRFDDLRRQKSTAIAREDFVRAGQLKRQLDLLEALHIEKELAITQEDFTRAAVIKREVDALLQLEDPRTSPEERAKIAYPWHSHGTLDASFEENNEGNFGQQLSDRRNIEESIGIAMNFRDHPVLAAIAEAESPLLPSATESNSGHGGGEGGGVGGDRGGERRVRGRKDAAGPPKSFHELLAAKRGQKSTSRLREEAFARGLKKLELRGLQKATAQWQVPADATTDSSGGDPGGF